MAFMLLTFSLKPRKNRVPISTSLFSIQFESMITTFSFSLATLAKMWWNFDPMFWNPLKYLSQISGGNIYLYIWREYCTEKFGINIWVRWVNACQPFFDLPEICVIQGLENIIDRDLHSRYHREYTIKFWAQGTPFEMRKEGISNRVSPKFLQKNTTKIRSGPPDGNLWWDEL